MSAPGNFTSIVSRGDTAALAPEQTSGAALPPAERAAYRLGRHAGHKLHQLGEPSMNRLDGKMRPTLAAAWRRGYADAHAEHRAGR